MSDKKQKEFPNEVLAVIGLTALIDEATGYQQQRKENELQKMAEELTKKKDK